MMRLVACGSAMKFNRWVSKSLVIGLLSTLGVCAGVLPSFFGKQAFLGVPVVQAQTFSAQEITSYARTVLKVEEVRLQAYDEIKQKMVSGKIPNIVCNQEETLNALPPDVRPIAINYCNQSKQIVESNGLTSAQFNAITVSQQNDQALGNRIKEEMKRLQNGGQ